MRRFVGSTLLTLGLISVSCITSGCGGGGDKVLKNDPKVSEKKGAEYEQQMKDAMENSKPKSGGKPTK